MPMMSAVHAGHSLLPGSLVHISVRVSIPQGHSLRLKQVCCYFVSCEGNVTEQTPSMFKGTTGTVNVENSIY